MNVSKNMKRDWPSLDSQELWKHEWESHGQFSDLKCDEYYRQGLFLHKSCDVKKVLEESGVYPSQKNIDTNCFKNQLAPKIGEPELHCSGIKLVEVRCCFDRNDMRRNCPQPQKSTCGPELIYPPIATPAPAPPVPAPAPAPPVLAPHTCSSGFNSRTCSAH